MSVDVDENIENKSADLDSPLSFGVSIFNESLFCVSLSHFCLFHALQRDSNVLPLENCTNFFFSEIERKLSYDR
jgi:hypothetical protein